MYSFCWLFFIQCNSSKINSHCCLQQLFISHYGLLYSIVWMYHSISIHLLMDTWIASSCIINTIVTNICIVFIVWWYISFFFGKNLRVEWLLCGMYIVNFLGNLPTVSGGLPYWLCYHQSMRRPIALRSHQPLLGRVSLVIPIVV